MSNMPMKMKLFLREFLLKIKIHILMEYLVRQTAICDFGMLTMENVFKQCVVTKMKKILLVWQQMELTSFVVSHSFSEIFF